MASWQAALISAIVRARVKRRLHGAEVDALAWRRRFGQPSFLRALFARRGRIMPVTSAPIRGGEWVEPRHGAAVDGRTILYLHGGGYFFCSPQTHRPITTALANLARARVFVPDYRLAPEHRFPAAVDDAVAAVRWLRAQGVDMARLAIGGDSAGGGLTLATLLSLRDAGESLPAGAFCLSPWTDLAGTGRSLVTNDESCAMFYGDGIVPAGRVYLGDVAPTHPLASPLYAEYAGLPPLLIHVSATETLLDDATRVADKARAAGVSVMYREWRDVPHVWQLFHPMLPEARESLADIARFVVERTSAAIFPPCESGPASAQ